MRIAIASGKGGTGKTMVAVNLALTKAACSENVQLLDCDVEGPNCHVFIKPTVTKRETVEVPVPKIDQEACTHCGVCGENCEFNAIVVGRKTTLLLPELCHACGVCSHVCPFGAITEIPRQIGTVESGYGNAPYPVSFTHGSLNPGEPLAPTVIGRVKDTAGEGTVFLDAPAGNSCSMVESVMDSDFCLLVTEPTPFGLHDLRLAVETLKKLGVPGAVVINRCNLGDDRVREYCAEEGLPVLLEIPLDRRIAKLYARGEPIITHIEAYKQMFQQLLRQTEKQCLSGRKEKVK